MAKEKMIVVGMPIEWWQEVQKALEIAQYEYPFKHTKGNLDFAMERIERHTMGKAKRYDQSDTGKSSADPTHSA